MLLLKIKTFPPSVSTHSIKSSVSSYFLFSCQSKTQGGCGSIISEMHRCTRLILSYLKAFTEAACLCLNLYSICGGEAKIVTVTFALSLFLNYHKKKLALKEKAAALNLWGNNFRQLFSLLFYKAFASKL